MALQQVWIFPVLMSVLIPVTLIITYLIAVYNKHVDPVFPYISDTGTIPPESCIFGQFLNVAALLVGIIVYIRHRQIVEFYGKSPQRRKPCVLNSSKVFLWFGYATCVGLSIVANFQETSVRVVHFIGAFMAFGGGLLYAYGQTVLTYKIDKIFVGIWMAHCRVLICILGTACVVIMQLGFDPHSLRAYLSEMSSLPVFKVEHGQNLTDTEHDWYLVSAATEWGIALCCVLFFCTFAAEFRRAIIPSPKMLFSFSQHGIHCCLNSDQESTAGNQCKNFEKDISQFHPLLQTTSNLISNGKKQRSFSCDEIYKRNKNT